MITASVLHFPLSEILHGIGPRNRKELWSRTAKSVTKPKAQLFKAHDYLQEGVHLAAAAAVAVLAGIWAGPVTLACCAAGSAVMVVGGFKLADKFLPKMFKRRKINQNDFSGLAQALKDFTSRAGLKRKPALYDFELDKEELAKRKDSIPSTPPQLNRVVNTAAVNLTKPVVLVSEPLLQLMQPPETRAIVAHEFTHLGAHHTRLRMLASWLQTTTMFTAMFGVGAVVVSQGFWIGALSIAGTIAIAHIGNKLMPKQQDRYTRDGTVRPRARKTQFAIWAAQESLSVGLLAMYNPIPVLTAVATEHGFFWSANLILRSLSRRQEFQADRGAVALGANPLALVTSLRKLEAVLKRDEPELSRERDWRQGSWLARAAKCVTSLYKSHPDTVRRCRRLAAMAAKQGYTAAEIAHAMTGPLDISSLPVLQHTHHEQDAHEAKGNQLMAAAVDTGLVTDMLQKGKDAFRTWKAGTCLTTPCHCGCQAQHPASRRHAAYAHAVPV